MTQEELYKIVEQHQHWLKKDCEGWEEMKANLKGANLEVANLEVANLKGANLEGEDFRLGKIITEPMTGYKACIYLVMIWFHRFQCEEKVRMSGNDCHWELFTGCQVKVNGQWIPYEKWRSFE